MTRDCSREPNKFTPVGPEDPLSTLLYRFNIDYARMASVLRLLKALFTFEGRLDDSAWSYRSGYGADH